MIVIYVNLESDERMKKDVFGGKILLLKKKSFFIKIGKKRRFNKKK